MRVNLMYENMKGTYVLIVRLSGNREMEIGSLGEIKFDRGWYAYVGSGLKSLENRIGRHLRGDKKLHWHIDYLLEKARVEETLFGESADRKECKVAEMLCGHFESVENFGSSDCDCESHLFYSEDFEKLKGETFSSLRKAGLKPEEW